MAQEQTLEIPFLEYDGTTVLKYNFAIPSSKHVPCFRKLQRTKTDNMLNRILRNTAEFIESVPKAERKQYGQFFTSVQSARHMADMFHFDLSKPTISILDAGAGTGLLSAAAICHLAHKGYTGHIHVVCYETDEKVLPILTKNLEFLKSEVDISYVVNTNNYITSQPFERLASYNKEVYDYIIGNPPYLKIAKDAPEALWMPQVCYGAPNLYFLFWAMGIYNLKADGELVYIVPRSWTSGAYFEHFRNYLFAHAVITGVHLFVSRDKVFNQESVLQETIIVRIKKTNVKPKLVEVTSSSSATYDDTTQMMVPYETIVAKNQYVFLVTNEEEAKVLQRVNKLTETLPTLDLRMRTGIIVDFRTREVLRNKAESSSYPLFYSSHIKDGKVIWPIGKDGEHIVTDRKGFLQPNGNYLFVKRFTSKEEPRRLQCGMYRQKDYPQYKYISTQNKINYIACTSLCVLYGMYALMGSTLYDQYYRILNGSTQVNSTEINTMPVPSRNVIEAMGRELMNMPITENSCNYLVEKWIS